MAEYRKKLIEVALPLEEINAACKADKDRKTGTIRNLHKWFAPMPLPAWRALLYAALIDDPGEEDARNYHLELIKRLVRGGADLPDQRDLDEALDNLKAQFPTGLPRVLDPFCGGGSTLVEAQRLGLFASGSDLNPVPALISRVLVEVLPSVWDMNPLSERLNGVAGDRDDAVVEQLALSTGAARSYDGLEGLVADVLHYGQQVLAQVAAELSSAYPKVAGVRPIAWLWVRTCRCPNPACALETPLATSWWLSKKPGERAWLEPSVVGDEVVLQIRSGQERGEAPEPPKSGRGASFSCVGCASVLTEQHLIEHGLSKSLGLRMTCVVEEVSGKRIYREPEDSDLDAAQVHLPDGLAEVSLGPVQRFMSPPRFGFTHQRDLYTPRQLLTMHAFATAVAKVPGLVLRDGGSNDYARAVTAILGLAVGRRARYGSSQSQWRIRSSAHAKAESAFARNDVPMMWDFAETFFESSSVGDWMDACRSTCSAFQFAVPGAGEVVRRDARMAGLEAAQGANLVATDPPYFDAIGYADLSDYFYIWHRTALREVFPDLYATIAAPRAGELTAIPSHHGNDREAARQYFIRGFTETFKNLQVAMHPELPMLVVYASKEQKAGQEEETRWSSILTAMLESGLEITGTWPIRGTGSSRMVSLGTNSVATYVVMAARPRPSAAPNCSLQEFNRVLRRELRPAVHALQAAGTLPVDLAQAAMGPGMQVFSRFSQVLDQAGSAVKVDLALRLINQGLAEVLDEQEGDLDEKSRFAVTWWSRHQWAEAPFGEADQLARPSGLSVDVLARSGIVSLSRPGFVCVQGNRALDRSWSPETDKDLTAWEAVHHLADQLIDGGGVMAASAIMARLGAVRDSTQSLVYRLHAIAARNGWTKDQERYNALIGSWSDLLAEAGRVHNGELF